MLAKTHGTGTAATGRGQLLPFVALIFVKKGTKMRKQIFKLAAVCAAFGSMTAAAPAFAQEEPADEEEAEGPVDVSVTLTAVSDYRFRGVSLSDKDPAFQPGITVSHESGIYVGAWAST
jgi:uncharacterized protein (TIGR02001 family)